MHLKLDYGPDIKLYLLLDKLYQTKHNIIKFQILKLKLYFSDVYKSIIEVFYFEGDILLTADLAWIITANMGLGHQRATYPLRDAAADRIFLFGEDFVKSTSEKRLWGLLQDFYESLSRTSEVPIIGPHMSNFLGKVQSISPYYPFRDQSQPSFQVKYLYSLIRKGMGSGLSSKLSTQRLPVITSFYAAAMAAEESTDLPVYCIICDADVNRAWVAKDPKKSRIIYFVPCGLAMRRLQQYGVPDERIYLTGFPLPQGNIGGLSMPILRHDLSERLIRLDPTHRFSTIHGEEVRFYLGNSEVISDVVRPITITYAIGGAGAQTEIARDALYSLAPLIRSNKVRLNLVAGIREKVYKYLLKLIDKTDLYGDRGVHIIYNPNINEYFREFNHALHATDLLWTKPSELSFYCGLGIPVIIAPCIGPHEVANKRWLQEIGAGIPQMDARYCGEWITDYLVDGRLAQAAWDGFLYARRMGAYKIEEVLKTGSMTREISPVKR